MGSGEEVAAAKASTSPPCPHEEAGACFTAAREQFTEAPAHVDFDGPEGSQRKGLLYAVPSKMCT